MENPLDYNGKVALVTGAGSGMGLVTANAFAEAGALAFFRNTLLSTYCHRNGDSVRVLRMIVKRVTVVSWRSRHGSRRS
jgi:NAD(P)-dependent dehydrogenase (short-subunit alcohol dehydrogenase family)